MASTLGEVRSLALRESDELRKGFEGLENFRNTALHCQVDGSLKCLFGSRIISRCW